MNNLPRDNQPQENNQNQPFREALNGLDPSGGAALSSGSASAGEEPITVRIKTMDNTVSRVTVLLDSTIRDFKLRIQEQLHVPVDRQRLIYLGKQLKDELTLRESKVKHDV